MNADFPRAARLTQSIDFNHVFSAPERKSSDTCFTVLGRSCLHGERARLGLVVAKKHVKRAHDRNRIKRLVRESFRHIPTHLQGYDIVVIAKARAEITGNSSIFKSLERHWGQIWSS